MVRNASKVGMYRRSCNAVSRHETQPTPPSTPLALPPPPWDHTPLPPKPLHPQPTTNILHNDIELRRLCITKCPFCCP